MGRARLLVSDFVISFMWAWSGVLVKQFVCKNMGLCNEALGEILKVGLNIINMFIFALLGKVTHGGASNPITILAGAVSGDFDNFLYCMGARIPTQVSFFVVYDIRTTTTIARCLFSLNNLRVMFLFIYLLYFNLNEWALKFTKHALTYR